MKKRLANLQALWYETQHNPIEATSPLIRSHPYVNNCDELLLYTLWQYDSKLSPEMPAWTIY
jgi:hypothetical protein